MKRHLHDSPETSGGAPVALEAPALVARRIHKAFDGPSGRLEVLKSVDLEVARGTILAILGASGAGKSTLLNILGTLLRPDSGTLEIGGERIDPLNGERLARLRSERLGFVFQFHHLLPEFSAEENVMMPMLIGGAREEEARARARESLAAVGLRERWEHRPSELSGGEAQRVAVARALVTAPALVLADEPSGNLDPDSAEGLHELVATLAAERHQTFVLVTHNARLADRAHRVLVLESGALRPASGGA